MPAPPKQSQDTTVYVLTLKPLPGADAIRALRWALKRMLRRYGLRCIAIAERHDG